MSVRDIDPSCILKEFPNTKPSDTPTFENYKKSRGYNAWGQKIKDSSWLKKTRDLPQPTSIIELTDDKGINWLELEGFIEWQKETPPEQEKYDLPTRTLWYMSKSYLLKKQGARKLQDWAVKQNFYGRWMPESHEFYDIYLAEYPWAPSFLHHYVPYYNHDEWTNDARGKALPTKILVTDDEYLSSGSSTDCSTNGTIRAKLPAKWIIDSMGLEQKYVDARFFDKHGVLIAFDPSIFDISMHGCVLIRKDKFIAFLKQQKCTILWTLLGEKNLIGGRETERSIGRLEVNGAYFLEDNQVVIGTKRSVFIDFNVPKSK